MKSEVKKYTFEDWRNGKIPVPESPYESENLDWQLRWQATNGGENRLFRWTISEPTRLSKEEYSRILDEKREAWFKAARRNADFQFERFTVHNERTPKENLPEVIQQEIEAVSKWFDDFDDARLKQKALKGDHFKDLITPEVYNKIQDGQYLHVDDFVQPYPKEVIEWINDKQQQLRRHPKIKNPTTWQDQIILFVATQQHEYLIKLKWILETMQAGGTKIDMNKLKALVDKANRILQNDTDGIYKPYRGNPTIPNNLKKELADHFKMGKTTVYDWFDKYVKRDSQGKYKIEPKYLFFS